MTLSSRGGQHGFLRVNMHLIMVLVFLCLGIFVYFPKYTPLQSIYSANRGSISIHILCIIGSSEYEYDEMSAVTSQHTFSPFGVKLTTSLGVYTVKPPCLSLASVYLAEILLGFAAEYFSQIHLCRRGGFTLLMFSLS